MNKLIYIKVIRILKKKIRYEEICVCAKQQNYTGANNSNCLQKENNCFCIIVIKEKAFVHQFTSKPIPKRNFDSHIFPNLEIQNGNKRDQKLINNSNSNNNRN